MSKALNVKPPFDKPWQLIGTNK